MIMNVRLVCMSCNDKSVFPLTRILSENTGRPFAQVAADTERDNDMSAQEALAYRLIGKIIDKR